MSGKYGFRLFYAISFAWQLGFLIVVTIGGFILLGIWGDKILKTHPILLVVGIVVGLSITVYEVYRLLFTLVKEK